MLDFNLAELYGVPTKVLNQSVTRSASRFTPDFLFLLSDEEVDALNRSQSVTSSGAHKHRDPRHRVRAFTQEGVAMLSGVLRSDRAIEVNIVIMRTFVRLREALMTNEDLARKVEQHDQEIGILVEQVRGLLDLLSRSQHEKSDLRQTSRERSR
jgi:hypothetical protein